MCHGLLPDVKFFLTLVEFDEATAKQVRAAGCSCGGKLHRADYPRKPRGLLAEVEPAFSRRISFCCNQEGCRARTTPPSIRFFGHMVYAAAIVLLATAAYCQKRETQGSSHAATNAAVAFDVPRRNLRRWSAFFTSILPASRGYQAERSRFMPPLDESRLPLSLLERFSGGPPDQLMQALKFVATITAPTRRASYAVLDKRHAEHGIGRQT
jgi:hypothetical protein